MFIEANDIDYSYKSTDRTELNRLTAQKGDCDDIVIVKNGLHNNFCKNDASTPQNS